MVKSSDRTAEILDRLLQEIKLEDLMIMAAGALAGSQGYTPMSAMIKGMSEGGQDTGAGGIKDKLVGPPVNPLLGLPGLVIAFFLSGGVLGVDPTGDEPQKANSYALAAIGMIEAYAITRPGAIQGIADIIGSIAGVIKGVGSNAAAAAILK